MSGHSIAIKARRSSPFLPQGLRIRNVYVLGILHGWLGALFYYTVVDRDPFIEVFGKLMH